MLAYMVKHFDFVLRVFAVLMHCISALTQCVSAACTPSLPQLRGWECSSGLLSLDLGPVEAKANSCPLLPLWVGTRIKWGDMCHWVIG